MDHYNTDNPHTHIVVRGIADDGKDLVIAREYMSSGLRERASALMTDALGPRRTHEITSALRREVTQDRFTSIDRKLLRMADDGMVDMRGQPPEGYARFNHSLRLGRLAKLQDMQLATEVKTGIWYLSENMEATLRELGLRGDIIKTMHAEMARSGRPTLSKDYEIFRPEDERVKRIIGKLIGKGLSDELGDRYYLVVEGVDGKTHYADIGQTADIDAYKPAALSNSRRKTQAHAKPTIPLPRSPEPTKGFMAPTCMRAMIREPQKNLSAAIFAGLNLCAGIISPGGLPMGAGKCQRIICKRLRILVTRKPNDPR